MERTIGKAIEEVKRLLNVGRVEEASLVVGRDIVIEGEATGKQGQDFWRDVAVIFRDVGSVERAGMAWKKASEKGLSWKTVEKEVIIGWVLEGAFGKALEGAWRLLEEGGPNLVNSGLYATILLENGRTADAVREWRKHGQMAGKRHCPVSTEAVQLSLTTMAIERFLLGKENEIAEQDGLREENTHAVKSESAPARTRSARLRMIDKALQAGNCRQALAWIEGERRKRWAHCDQGMAFLQAQVLGEMGKWNRSREVLASFIGRSEGNKALEAFYAYCLVHCGEAEMALEVLRREGADGPDDYSVNYFQGCAWLTLGDRIRAFCHFRLAFRRFFFDTYHLLFMPQWEKVTRLVEKEEKSGEETEG